MYYLLSFGHGSPNHLALTYPEFQHPLVAQLERPISFVSKGLRGSGSQSASQPASQLDVDSVQGLGSRGQTEQADDGHDGWRRRTRTAGKLHTMQRRTDGRTLLFVFLPRTLLVQERTTLFGSAKNRISNFDYVHLGSD